MTEAPAFIADAARKRLKRRYREEGRFRAYGVAAVVFAVVSLLVLLGSVIGQSVSAFTRYELSVETVIDPEIVDPTGKRDPQALASNVSAFSQLLRRALQQRFPEAQKDRALSRQLNRFVSTLSARHLAEMAGQNPGLVGATMRVSAPLSDTLDLYLKGLVTDEELIQLPGDTLMSGAAEMVTIRREGAFAPLQARLAELRQRDAATREATIAELAAASAATQARLDALKAEKAAIATLDRAGLDAKVAATQAEASPGDLALAREAGRAAASGDDASLRAALDRAFADRTSSLRAEAGELAAKGDKYAARALKAEAAGEPTAETRRIQAETAWLTADRKFVDAALLESRRKALAGLSGEALLAEAELLLDRPLGPLAGVAGAANPADLLTAVKAFNLAEQRLARVRLADANLREAALKGYAGELLARGRDARAALVEEKAVASAQSRVKRARRELDVLGEHAARLALISPGLEWMGEVSPDGVVPPDQAPDALRSFVETEAAAQLGLDMGGALALAHASAGANADNALRALLGAALNRDLTAAETDLVIVARKTERLRGEVERLRAEAAAPEITLNEFDPSLLAEIGGGVVKIRTVGKDSAMGYMTLGPAKAAPGEVPPPALLWVDTPEADRLVSDAQIGWIRALEREGSVKRVANLSLLTHADSTYPELAGLAAALAGSFWIMFVTLLLSLPLGVAAAVYLECFAPKNRLTDLIEVNINNLAAVPSIVFGLLGGAVFINFFGLPRSAPIVGGLVLSLMTLPTIIIATRASLAAVPPSIRDGALAVGASLPQAVFHHVLPLATPGILTGSIIGLARALGETAPLLLIGMVAFVAEPPKGLLDSATALPVLVYKWSTGAERAWQPMTSAAILVLLLFMFLMNAVAVYLRRRLERRW